MTHADPSELYSFIADALTVGYPNRGRARTARCRICEPRGRGPGASYGPPPVRISSYDTCDSIQPAR